MVAEILNHFLTTSVLRFLLMRAVLVTNAEPNPPDFGSNVHIFAPTDSAATIETAVNAAYATNGGQTTGSSPPNEFSAHRYAFLFKPGTYSVDVPVGYYTSIAGLGTLPSDVVFAGSGKKGVYCEQGSKLYTTGALDTFWRSAENFRSESAYAFGTGTGMLWAVSQAAPLRRIEVANDLVLYQYYPPPYDGPKHQAGYGSGGFLANAVVSGTVKAGGQQQWISRNVQMDGWLNGGWSMVTVGCVGGEVSACQQGGNGPQWTAVQNTPVVAEKPYIVYQVNDTYQLVVPPVRHDSIGADFSSAPRAASRKRRFLQGGGHALQRAAFVADGDRIVDFSRVYVAQPGQGVAAVINAKLSSGDVDAVVLAPGIYELESPLVMASSDQVLLGLGFATLVATQGNALITVHGGLSGVRVAGLLLQAGSTRSDVLLDVGSQGSDCEGCVLSDIFARVGGPDTDVVSAGTMVRVSAGNVVIDNMWLWRADHKQGGVTHPADNPCDHGIVVSGDDVTAYGLAVEHTLQTLTEWAGERGAVYFYQSELPYDVTQSFADAGYVGYSVADNVTAHTAHAVGVYHYFRDNAVTIHTGITCPTALLSSFVNPYAVYLNGRGVMQHVINDDGAATQSGGTGGAVVAYVC